MSNRRPRPSVSDRPDDRRADLFGKSPTKNTSNRTAQEAAAIQQSLGRTQSLLERELDRISNLSSAIDQDGKLLQETMHTQQSLNVKSAKQALTALQRAEQEEDRILMAALVFFHLVLVYIFWSRVVSHVPLVEPILAWVLHRVGSLGQLVSVLWSRLSAIWGDEDKSFWTDHNVLSHEEL